MVNSSLVLYVLGELCLLLLAITVGLLIYTRGLKKLVATLEDKVLNLRKVLQNTKEAALLKFEELQKTSAVNGYLGQLDEQIHATRAHHRSLGADRDITLDLAQDVSQERKTASFRHAVLLAEKEAMLSSDTTDPAWDVLQNKFQQLLRFFQGPDAAVAPASAGEDVGMLEATIEAQKKQIANLEKFKKLFFELESKWNSAQASAEGVQHQLSAMANILGAGDDFDDLLKQYVASYSDVNHLISGGAGAGVDDSGLQRAGTKTVVIDRREEVDALRRMAMEQHGVINDLKRRLYEAKSDEQRQRAVSDTQEELSRYQRFVKEAETCIEQMEAEISEVRAHAGALEAENERLKRDVKMLDGHIEGNDQLKTQLQELQKESSGLRMKIRDLEQENQQLRSQPAAPAGGGQEAATLKARLQEVQQELLNLQTQHIELEDRYIELRSRMG